mgnify:FL=1
MDRLEIADKLITEFILEYWEDDRPCISADYDPCTQADIDDEDACCVCTIRHLLKLWG